MLLVLIWKVFTGMYFFEAPVMILVDLKYSFIHQTILLQAFLFLSAMIINSSSFMQPGSQEMICVKWRGHNSLFSAKETEGFIRFQGLTYHYTFGEVKSYQLIKSECYQIVALSDLEVASPQASN